jgi:hypothetical protein
MGMEHHVSIVYGDWREELRAFGKLAGLQVVDLTEE